MKPRVAAVYEELMNWLHTVSICNPHEGSIDPVELKLETLAERLVNVTLDQAEFHHTTIREVSECAS